MSSLVDKIKSKATGKSSEPQQQQQQQNEPSFGILPHPAKTNDPRDLEPPQPGGGLNSKPESEAFHARDPHVPSPQVLNNLPPAKSREELRARAQELNQD
ncbi:hypothetical protein OH76DRAFT_1340857 [Lentinus brumalis]|uniref:Uncharacterized protein n=1 Tax=Lentinus brumalis TaxID=2498619 RepID=A0A371DPT1_9APHY|nr:hypothetical protein OH76DRAFT_1340857 [Polyporus brumalis]